MPFVVVEVQPTPNPNALKFLLDHSIADQPVSFFNADAAEGHPIAAQIFKIAGVSSLLFLNDFVTVNKQPTVHWADITGQVRRNSQENLNAASKQRVESFPPAIEQRFEHERNRVAKCFFPPCPVGLTHAYGVFY